MNERVASLAAIAWRGLFILLIAYVAVVAWQTYVPDWASGPPPIVANGFANPFLIIHVVAGVTALVVGPLQFVGRIRERAPGLHRATGMIYVAACAISAPAAFMLALGTTAGPVAGTGFAMLAVLLGLFTFLGLRAALERRFGDHRRWMMRSYALTATAVTLRLMLPAAGLLGLDFVAAYRVIAWLSWITNLMLCEYLIRRDRTVANSYSKFATA